MDRMKSLKIICSLVCFLLLASQVSSMLHWNEARGVFDDICYLRQAHLFQRFGLKGFDTDISRDDDGYLAAKLKEINFPADEPPPCHTPMPLANKLVIQYPPGTGMALAIFPAGHQVVPLFVSATIVVFGFALLGIRAAPSSASLAAAGVLGCLAVYIMINPVKASYSMAPTMAICAVAGFLTAKLFSTVVQLLHNSTMAPSRLRQPSRLLSYLVLAAFALPTNALYFYMTAGQPRCFYEELPKDTLVVGQSSTTVRSDNHAG